MILLILCIMVVVMVGFIEFLLMTENSDFNIFEAFSTVISMNILLYFAITYIIEKASLISWL